MENGLAYAKGYVFEDEMRSGVRTASSKGVSGVLVSNQQEVTVTDENGYYELPLHGPCCIMISKPAGYDLPLDVYNQPSYYYQYEPDGTPADLELDYEGIDATGALPESIDFPLYKGVYQKDFTAIMMGDIQPKTEEEVGYFRDLVARELAHREARFLMPLGDLVWDELNLFELVRQTLRSIGLPYYPVCGNHDINLKAPKGPLSRTTFRKYFGPTYYSFDEGQVHFVVLDDIGYAGWNTVARAKGSTEGYLDARQLAWLANDLARVEDDKLVFIASHIPIYTSLAKDNPYRNIQNREALFELLNNRKHLFAVAAHTHLIEQVDLREGGWKGAADFRTLIAGAACGAWWKGPKDLDGIPVRLALDGSPNGYFEFHFKGNQFEMHFCPAGQHSCRQMGIRQPQGDVPLQSEDLREVLVNIYRAAPDAEVAYRLNDGPPRPMQRLIEADPYVQRFIDTNRDAYPEWMNARTTAHLWRANLEEQLAPGLHTIEVAAREPNGQELRSSQAFRVTEASILPHQEKKKKRKGLFRSLYLRRSGLG